MRRFLIAAFFALTSLINVGLFVKYAEGVRPLPVAELNKLDGHGTDFRYRYNEITVLRKGVNPFYVWDGVVDLKPYFPHFDAAYLERPGYEEPINAYPPWEYIFMMPITFVPRTVAWPIWYCIMFASLCAIVWYAFVRGRAVRGDSSDGLLAAAVAQMISFPIYFDLHCGNFPLVVSAVLALMVWALNRRYDVLAGICWAFAMVKPQMAALFVFPFLVQKRYKVVLVSGLICLSFALIAAWMCGTNVIELIFQGPRASAFAFEGNAVCPGFLLRGHPALVPYALAGGILFGVAASAWISWRLRKEQDWLVQLAPIAIIATAWTYAQMYNFAIVWMMMLVLALTAIRRRSALVTFWSMLGIAVLAGTTPVVGKAIDIVRCGSWNGTDAFVFGCDIWRPLVVVVVAVWLLWRRRVDS